MSTPLQAKTTGIPEEASDFPAIRELGLRTIGNANAYDPVALAHAISVPGDKGEEALERARKTKDRATLYRREHCAEAPLAAYRAVLVGSR